MSLESDKTAATAAFMLIISWAESKSRVLVALCLSLSLSGAAGEGEAASQQHRGHCWRWRRRRSEVSAEIQPLSLYFCLEIFVQGIND